MTTNSDRTTVSIPRELKDSLDEASEAIFGTDEIPYKTVIQRLIEDCESAQ